MRGVNELSRTPGIVHKGEYYYPDTDFIVGEIINYLEKQGYICHWKHLNDNPSSEKTVAENCNSHNKFYSNPICQDVFKVAVRLKKKYKVKTLKRNLGVFEAQIHNECNLQVIPDINKM